MLRSAQHDNATPVPVAPNVALPPTLPRSHALTLPVRGRLGRRRPALSTSRSSGVGRGARAARFAAPRWSGRCLALLALLLVLPLLPASPMAQPGQERPVDRR